MNFRLNITKLALGLLPFTGGLINLSPAASALEACVRCDNPFAIYRCQVDQPGLPANASISLICITELAKKKGHATCAVSRETGAACSGDIVAVMPSPDAPIPQSPPPELIAETPKSDSLPAAPTAAPDELSPGESNEQAEGPQPINDAPPETVEELAKETAKASQKTLKQAGGVVVDAAKKTGETIEQTGDAIGNAAKKTWQCISSLFGNC